MKKSLIWLIWAIVVIIVNVVTWELISQGLVFFVIELIIISILLAISISIKKANPKEKKRKNRTSDAPMTHKKTTISLLFLLKDPEHDLTIVINRKVTAPRNRQINRRGNGILNGARHI